MPVRTPHRTHTLVILVAMIGLAGPALGQWLGSPAYPRVVADATGEQAHPAIAATADGGCYVSWFDAGAGGYDVRLQRLDAQGRAQWPSAGVLVADRGVDFAMQYGLAVDTGDCAVLSFRDDRLSGVQITAARIAPDGTPLWGPAGIQLTPPGAEVLSPRVTTLRDGGSIVAWTRVAPSGESTAVEFQKLTPAGVPAWSDDVVLSDVEGGSYFLCDVSVTADGAFVILWTRQGTGPCAPLHLWAQKFTREGRPLWSDPVVVFDGGTLQFGDYPPLVADEVGGVVLAWTFFGSTGLDCAAQRLLADGGEWLPHNGITGSIAYHPRSGPAVAFNQQTQSLLFFWEETQVEFEGDTYAVYGQKLAPERGRLWGPYGQLLVPYHPERHLNIVTLPCGVGATVHFASQASAVPGLHTLGVDDEGEYLWSPGWKLAGAHHPWHLVGAPAPADACVVIWTDGDAIYGQRVNADGTFGLCESAETYPADPEHLDGGPYLGGPRTGSRRAFTGG